MKTQLYGCYVHWNLRCLQPDTIGCDAATWSGQYVPSVSRSDFKNKRLNGDEEIDAAVPWKDKYPDEKTIMWTKGEKRSDGYVYGVREADGYYYYECRYDADAEDLEWMRQTIMLPKI